MANIKKIPRMVSTEQGQDAAAKKPVPQGKEQEKHQKPPDKEGDQGGPKADILRENRGDAVDGSEMLLEGEQGEDEKGKDTTKDPAAQEKITPAGGPSSCQVTISVAKKASVAAVEGRDKESKKQPHVAVEERSASDRSEDDIDVKVSRSKDDTPGDALVAPSPAPPGEGPDTLLAQNEGDLVQHSVELLVKTLRSLEEQQQFNEAFLSDVAEVPDDHLRIWKDGDRRIRVKQQYIRGSVTEIERDLQQQKLPRTTR